jgi:hypothetical protein
MLIGCENADLDERPRINDQTFPFISYENL